MKYKKIIAIARAKDTQQNIDSIIDYLYFKLLLVLGPNGKLKSNKDECLFFFDTFDGVSMKAKAINDKLIEKNYFLSNLFDEKKEKTIHKFFELEGSFFKINKTFLNEDTAQEDFAYIIEDLISICGGGLLKTIDFNDIVEVKIISGKTPTQEEIDKAIELTKKMCVSNVFDEKEKEMALSKTNDGIPIGYFIGLFNGFLTNRYVITDRITDEEIHYLLPLYSILNTNFIQKHPSPYNRILFLYERLNTLSFIQYLVQIKKIKATFSDLMSLYEQNIEEYSNFINNQNYDVQKNIKGVKDLLLFMNETRSV